MSLPQTTPVHAERHAAERSKLRRLLHPIEGDTDIFSSERSFAPPIGANLGTPGRPSGYYIDLSLKAATPRWPPAWLEDPDRQLHVASVQWALGAWEHYLAGEGEAWRAAAIEGAEHLLGAQQRGGVHDGAWLHWFGMPHTYRIDPPWASAITQGEAASLLARLHVETGEERFADAARRALRPLGVPTDGGGLMGTREGLPFFEEYPTRPGSFVLNGGIFALWGLFDAAHALGDCDARELYEAGLECLLASLPSYDLGYWSRYDLYPHTVPNVASGAYHLLHIRQLDVLARLAPDPRIDAVRRRFEAYRDDGAKRRRALAAKVAFRLVSPRNRLLSQRLPWSGPKVGDRADLVVLAYHGVSEDEDWDPGLAVTPAQLEHEVGQLLQEGYRPATFSDAILGPRRERCFAVTFDDCFESVATRGRPVLDRLGVPGTVFVPTDFPGSGRPLAWPGIESWLGTRHEAELAALDWKQLRALAERGWEIGSHTRGHPRLTELEDAALADELRDSRLECERRLGRPCRSIAYPYGDVDQRVVKAAARAGYAAGASLPPPWLASSPLAWPRVGVYGIDTPARFRLKVWRPSRWLRRPLAAIRRALGHELTRGETAS